MKKDFPEPHSRKLLEKEKKKNKGLINKKASK